MLYHKSYSPATITTFVSAVTFANKLYNAPNPQQHFIVTKMLEGSRKLSHKPDTRLPITLNILHKMIDTLKPTMFDGYTIVLLRAMFLLAFHGFFRVGELTVRSTTSLSDNTLKTANCNLTFHQGKAMAASLTLLNSKHNKAKPFTITFPASGTPYCPVAALHDYILLARPVPGPLFQLTNGTPVTRHVFQAHLTRVLRCARIDTARYKTHSFRVGAATEAVTSLGLTDNEVQRLGRWNSNAFRAYIRMPNFTALKR